jgi:hypothetical protein
MKTGPDVLDTAKNESESVKPENGTRRPQYPGKTTPGAQNMKTGAYGPSHSKKTCLGTQNMKTEADDLSTAENGVGSHFHVLSSRKRHRKH